MLLVNVLLAVQVGWCVSDSALSCDDNDDIVPVCETTSARRNCRCDELCPVFADCCRDYRQPVTATSLRGNVVTLLN